MATSAASRQTDGVEAVQLPPLCGLVLAGGESRRMGQDKGLLRFGHRTARAIAAEKLSAVCDEVFVSIRKDQLDALEPGLQPLIDGESGLGPSAGLLAAADHRPGAAWLVLACDYLLLPVAALTKLVSERRPGVVAIAFRGDDGLPEPLAAIWEPAALRALKERIATGRNSPRLTLIQIGALLVEPASPDWLVNVNDVATLGRLGNVRAEPG